MVVHCAGVQVDVQNIIDKTNGSISIVDDCAHSIGIKDQSVNDHISKQGCLSTFLFHEINGLLVVNDSKLWRRDQIIREKGTNRVDFFAGLNFAHCYT